MGRGQPLRDHEFREPVLERRSTVLDVALLGEEERPDAGAGSTPSPTALVDGRDLGNAEDLQPRGFVPSVLQFVRLGPFGDVEEGSGDGRDRNAVMGSDFARVELAPMNLGPGASSQQDLATSRRVDVDLRPVPGQSPECCGAPVAEERPRSRGEDGAEPLSALGERPWPEGIDLPVDGSQPTGGDPSLDRPSSHTDAPELSVGQQPLLLPGQPDDFPFPEAPRSLPPQRMKLAEFAGDSALLGSMNG
jgi:hypothetical protein